MKNIKTFENHNNDMKKESIKEKIESLIKQTTLFTSPKIENIDFYVKNDIVEFYVDKNMVNVVMFNEDNWNSFGNVLYGNEYSYEFDKKMRNIICDILDSIGIFGKVAWSDKEYHIEEKLMEIGIFLDKNNKVKIENDTCKLKTFKNLNNKEIFNLIKDEFVKYDWLEGSLMMTKNEDEFAFDIDYIQEIDYKYLVDKNIKIQKEFYIQSDDEHALYIYTDKNNNINCCIIVSE